MAAQPQRYPLSPEAYIALERTSDIKSEYAAGQVVMMTGTSRNHSFIVGNFAGELRTRLRGRRCEFHTSDMRVQLAQGRRYYYPDVVIVCGEPFFLDDHVDTLLNPTVIIEVLSPSTEAQDQGRKVVAYRQLPSLKEQILVAQDAPFIEQYEHQEDEMWTLTEIEGIENALSLTSVGVLCPLSEIHLNVELILRFRH